MKVKLLYFSPTGTTKKIVDTIASSLQTEKLESIDFTKKKIREDAGTDFAGDLVIIGAPVYYGRMPKVVTEYLSKLKVNNIPAVLVVVYGNRDYEGSLLELYDTVRAAGFRPIACAAFIGEHSFSTEDLPMAQGRPDESDLDKAKQFGATIQKDFDTLINNNLAQTFIPSDIDYRSKEIPKLPVTLVTLTEQCIKCESCIELCPADAIAFDEQSNLVTDMDSCIICFACVKYCPVQARGIYDPFWSSNMANLQKKCLARKEPEVFFSV